MVGAYEKGQKVLVEPVKNHELSPRDSALELYTGKIGTIIDVYWISMGSGVKNIYVYTVRIEKEDNEIVVHEDEIRAYSA